MEVDEKPFTRDHEFKGWMCSIEWVQECGKELPCGGPCVLPPGHLVPCECGGDQDGKPGTCPA